MNHPHRSRMLRTTIRVALAAALGAVPAAHAANAPVATLEEIVVTASKRVENVADVPSSIVVLGGERLEAEGVTSFADYQDLVPGLSFVSNGQPGRGVVSLRGISTGASQVSATVGWYLDDVQFGSSGSLAIGGTYIPDPDLFDVNRIEVLKGPQGTLYGAATLGGLMKVVRNAPELGKFSGRVGIEGNTVTSGDQGYAVRGMVNLPVSETSALRIVGTTRRDAGFIDNTFRNEEDENSSRTTTGRIAYLIKPSETFSAELSAFYQKSNSDGVNQTDVDAATLAPIAGELTTAENRFVTGNDTKYQVYAAKLDFTLGIGTLTSITSFANSQDDSLLDATGGIGIGLGIPFIQNIEFDKFTQEVRLASPESDSFEWLVGGFYTDERNDWHLNLTAYDPVTLAPFVPSFLIYDFTATAKYREEAVFANTTWHVAPTVDVVLGGRYGRNKQNYTYTRDGLINGGVRSSTTGKSDDNRFDYAAALQWRPGADTMFYARIASGYRPGGPQVSNIAGLNLPATYEPDSVRNYEIGVKGAGLDGRLQYDAAVYFVDWKDIQLLQAVIVQTPAGPVQRSLVANAGAASSRGAEIALRFAPEQGWLLGASIAYTDAQLDEAAAGLGGAKGEQIPYTAKWAGTLDGSYSWSLSSDVTATLAAGARYTGKRVNYFAGDPTGNVQATMPSYTQLDLRATFEWDTWDFGVRIDNLSDRRGIISAQTNGFQSVPPFAASIDTAAYIRPRTYAITIGKRF